MQELNPLQSDEAEPRWMETETSWRMSHSCVDTIHIFLDVCSFCCSYLVSYQSSASPLRSIQFWWRCEVSLQTGSGSVRINCICQLISVFLTSWRPRDPGWSRDCRPSSVVVGTCSYEGVNIPWLSRSRVSADWPHVSLWRYEPLAGGRNLKAVSE